MCTLQQPIQSKFDIVNNIYALIDVTTDSNELTHRANNIITHYDLHFTSKEIIKAFKSITKNYAPLHDILNSIILSLATNLRMFIAIMYALIDMHHKEVNVSFYYLTVTEGKLKLGCNRNIRPSWHLHVATTYCTLYDYYEFDMSSVILPDVARELIQNHINNKPVLTKRAVK